MFMDKDLFYFNLGLVDYKSAWDYQKKIFDLRYQKKIPDVLMLLEHNHTYTLGKVADRKNLVSSNKFLSENKIEVFEIDRGGDVTYHGPGQIVGYPIIQLQDWEKDTHKYLRALEQVIINTIAEFGISGSRKEKYTGVWVDEKKIAAIGIKVSRWITMHGFALNVNTDLNMFKGIIPCGISDKEVTSMQKEISKPLNLNEVKEKLVYHFQKIFYYTNVFEKSEEEFVNIIQ